MKSTEEQIKNATDAELAEWSAVYVKGWKLWDDSPLLDDYPDIDPFYVYKDADGEYICKREDWNPAQNIEQAWELIGKIQELALEDEFNYILKGTLYSQITARDITIAALLAVGG